MHDEGVDFDPGPINNLVASSPMAGIAGHLVLFSVCVSCTEKVPRLIIIHSLWIGIDPRKITPSAIIAVLHTLHHAN